MVKLIYLIVLMSDQRIVLPRHYKAATAIYWRRIDTAIQLYCFKSDTFF